MWVHSCFEGDNNEVLMWAQHDLYFLKNCEGLVSAGSTRGGTVWFMFREALTKLNRFVGDKVSFNLMLRLGFEKDGFDHRVLQDQHMRLAAYYRWLNRNCEPPIFSRDPKLYREFWIRSWREYLYHEMASLTNSVDFCEKVVESVVYQNTERGYKAETRTVQLLDERYGRQHIAFLDKKVASEKPRG